MLSIKGFYNKFKESDIKSRRVMINSALAFLIKGVSVIVSLVTLPAYMRYFENQEILGLWFTAVSVLSWILTFDMGIGNGLRNHLVMPLVNKDTIEVKKYISSAYVMVGSIVLLVSFIGYLLIPQIKWNLVFNISDTLISHQQLIVIVRLIFMGIMLQFFLRLISSILFAMQVAIVPSFLSLISSIFLLILVIMGDSEGVIKNIENLAIFNIITSNSPLLIATLIVFLTKLKSSKPNLKYFRLKYAIKVIKLGGIFFWLQLMTMVIFNTNEFLITWLSGPDKVVDYQIYNKIFALVGTLFNLLLTPIWSAVTEASAKKEIFWIRNLYKRLKQLAFVAIIIEIILAFFMQIIIDIWLGDKSIQVNIAYSITFALSGMIYIWVSVNSSITAGLGQLKTSFIYLSLGAFLNVPLAFIFSLLTNSWISIIFANIISMLPYCIIQPIILKKSLYSN